MYVPPEIIAKGGVEALALTNSFIKIVENLRKDKNMPIGIADIISQLETDAFVLTGKFASEIDALEKSLDKAGIPLDGKFGDLEETSWFWKNRHDKAMEAFEPTLKAIRQRLCGFIDDLVAIARCAGKEEILAVSFQQAAELKTKIRADTDVDTHNIKDILAVLRHQAEHFRGVLGTKK
jgi:hypothetical protein